MMPLDEALIIGLYYVMAIFGVAGVALVIFGPMSGPVSPAIAKVLKPLPREPLPLPKHVTARHRMYGDNYGSSYEKSDGTAIYADMRGGWTAAELRAIADDIEHQERTKER